MRSQQSGPRRGTGALRGVLALLVLLPAIAVAAPALASPAPPRHPGGPAVSSASAARSAPAFPGHGTLVQGGLGAISCATASACVAVGTVNDDLGANISQTQAGIFDGKRWRFVRMPYLPSGGGLDAVSCTSSSACTAVGFAARGTLAERLAGGRWRIQSMPSVPASSRAKLNGVSCASASSCIAVGWTRDSAGQKAPLAERWNGSSWTIDPTPEPAGAQYAVLAGVFCASATACEAVGSATVAGGHQAPLAERWNGTAWAIQATPTPQGKRAASLLGVSCVSAGRCMAVGDGRAGRREDPLAERYKGTAWSLQSTPALSRSGALDSVSCSSTHACVAVGTMYQFPLSERWNGGRWTVQFPPDPTVFDKHGYATSMAVSCAAPKSCEAVLNGIASYEEGSEQVMYHLAGAERLSNGTWALQRLPLPPRSGTQLELAGITCTAPDSCIAVGSYVGYRGPRRPLAEWLQGTRWTVMAVPSPADGGALDDVSCASAHACTAVGHSGSRTLVERFGGARWTITPSPTPAGANQVDLASVSCPSRSACTAVGYYFAKSSGNEKTLAERWNGTRWTSERTPSPAMQGDEVDSLYDVSCASVSACVAVGSNGAVSLAERWNGARWTVVPTPYSRPADGSGLNGVWCASAADCLGVGSHDSNKTFLAVPLAEQWNGKRWASAPIPNPYPHQETVLDALGCSSRSACTAVGGVPYSRIFAERWDGSNWAVQSTPVPNGASSPSLNDVACGGAQACVAIGTYFDHQRGDWVSFAERWNGTGWTVEPVAGMPR